MAFLSAYMLALAYANLPDWVFLQDHPLPGPAFWPALWLLLALAVLLLIPSGRRSRMVTALVFGTTGLLLACGGGLGLAIFHVTDSGSSQRGDLTDRVSSADGQYEVQVFLWESILAEPGWDVVIKRRDGVEADAGCLFSEATPYYEGILLVEAGSVRIATGGDPISIAFDPNTMQVTTPIPKELCGDY